MADSDEDEVFIYPDMDSIILFIKQVLIRDYIELKIMTLYEFYKNYNDLSELKIITHKYENLILLQLDYLNKIIRGNEWDCFYLTNDDDPKCYYFNINGLPPPNAIIDFCQMNRYHILYNTCKFGFLGYRIGNNNCCLLFMYYVMGVIPIELESIGSIRDQKAFAQNIKFQYYYRHSF